MAAVAITSMQDSNSIATIISNNQEATLITSSQPSSRTPWEWEIEAVPPVNLQLNSLVCKRTLWATTTLFLKAVTTLPAVPATATLWRLALVIQAVAPFRTVIFLKVLVTTALLARHNQIRD